MEKPVGYDQAESADSGRMQPPGRPYIFGVVGVSIQPKKDGSGERVMHLNLDIAEGPFKNYFTKLSQKANKDRTLRFFQGVDGKSLFHFKGLITSFEKSNNIKFDWNEKILLGKKIGGNSYEKEYQRGDGTIGTFLEIEHLCSTHHVTNGDLKVLPVKKLQIAEQGFEPEGMQGGGYQDAPPHDDSDLPF